MFKESVRLIINTFPYSCIPAQITINLIYFLIFLLNSLTTGNEISLKCSPREIVTGCHLDFKKNFKVVSVSYVDMNPRSHKCIALGKTVNI